MTISDLWPPPGQVQALGAGGGGDAQEEDERRIITYSIVMLPVP